MPPPVLVLRALGLGDALTAVPALRGLRHRAAGAPLVLAAAGPPADLLVELGVVDAVLPTADLAGPPPGRLLAERAGSVRHLAVNLHGRGPESHRLLSAGNPRELVAFANPEAGVAGPDWRQDEHEVLRWCRLVDHAGGSCDPADIRLPVPRGAGAQAGTVVIHPGAASGARRWPPGRWAAVAAHLARDRRVVLTGGAGEKSLTRRITEAAGLSPSTDLGGALSLPQLCALVASADLLCSGDTGVAHLATAYGTPSVRLFGPVPPAWWGPVVEGDRHAVLWHGDGTGDPHGRTSDPALTRITVEEVLSSAHALLAAARHTP